jgi:hypothetical protein
VGGSDLAGYTSFFFTNVSVFSIVTPSVASFLRVDRFCYNTCSFFSTTFSTEASLGGSCWSCCYPVSPCGLIINLFCSAVLCSTKVIILTSFDLQT